MFERGQMARPGHPRGPIAGALLLLLLALPGGAVAQEQAILSARDIVHPVFAENGMVASQEAVASRIGAEVLRNGGNAVDAAVAVGFALAVTLPRAGNLGGGGFMLVHDAESGETVAIDYREMAPASAHKDLFLDAKGEVDTDKAWYSRAAAGVPGTVAGLALALERYGTLSLAEAIQPAIRLARDGITVTRSLSDALTSASERLLKVPATAAIFFHPDGTPYQPGETLVQADLAWSLQQIAENGPKAFYEGAIAERIAADMAAHGGPMTETDLAAYKPVVRAPVTGSYRGHEIRSMPPPSSGGVHLVQILNILEGFPLAELGHNGAETIHLMAEAMKLAYADRSEYLGDPDFWPVPVEGLTSKAYADHLRATIDRELARPAEVIKPGDPLAYESPETTHFSVMDRWGNAVANTYTINFSYGSGIVAAGTGILLNNEMDDFSAKPGAPNAYGLIGGEANAIEPGKRPLSSMTPTLVLKDGKVLLATGSPGGPRIITTVLQILLNVIDHGMNLAEATYATRVHHQWLPDELRVEEGLSPDTLRALRAKGYTVVEKNAMGSAQSVLKAETGFHGAADPRRPGALAV
ncbi:MAG: gamma-glutamyltransferase, partial [Kiloniellales bacterium]|nr:gamma-glutamyltransferase [Kiloniellales bacterium]